MLDKLYQMAKANTYCRTWRQSHRYGFSVSGYGSVYGSPDTVPYLETLCEDGAQILNFTFIREVGNQRILPLPFPVKSIKMVLVKNV